jgi:hypothetical protein
MKPEEIRQEPIFRRQTRRFRVAGLRRAVQSAAARQLRLRGSFVADEIPERVFADSGSGVCQAARSVLFDG